MAALNILSHNAAWFLGYPQPTDQPDGYDPAIMARLVDWYRQLGPDIVCLQEVHTPETCLAAGELLGMRGAHTSGASLSQYGGAIFAKEFATVIDSSSLAKHVQRFWQKASVPVGDTHVTVCNLHLASDKHLGADVAEATRIDDLRGMLDAKPKPDVIAGDFNEAPDRPSGRLLREAGYIDAGALFKPAPASTGVNKGRSELIWVAGPWAERIAALEYIPYPSLENGSEFYLSDHHVLILRLIW